MQRSLGLSQEQRKELAQLRQLFIIKLNVIIEQRREIHHTLMVSARLCYTGVKPVVPLSCLHRPQAGPCMVTLLVVQRRAAALLTLWRSWTAPWMLCYMAGPCSNAAAAPLHAAGSTSGDCAAIQDAMPSALGARHTAIQFLKTQENIDRLKRNMKEEHVLKLDWISTLFKHVRLLLRYGCPDNSHGACLSCTASPCILHLITSSTVTFMAICLCVPPSIEHREWPPG